MVKEDAANAARFITAVRVAEVVVAPRLEPWIQRRVNALTRRTECAVMGALAMQAVRATLWSDLVGVGIIGGLAVVTVRAANRVALWAFLVFWGTLQTAKLNVFFGVKNPGTQLLPSSLAGLEMFFGPNRNSLLLPVTLGLLVAVTGLVVRRALRARQAHHRHSAAMLSVLLWLAVLEHALRGVAVAPEMWTMFLRARGG